ncbi:MAG: arginine repressor [Coriobacteriales bacterium]|jgi:transcriptional regulator of arginine metabolism
MRKKRERHEAIRTIIRSEVIRTQRELVDSLAELGMQCTQATVSRDIAEMGLQKTANGGYVLAEDLTLKKMLDMLTGIDYANNLIVMKVMPGTASGVAAALDSAMIPGILGTVAGDDTILVIAADLENAERFVDVVKRTVVLPGQNRG